MDMTKEAAAISAMAKVLKSFSDEDKCAIMAMVCIRLKEYDYAASFIRQAAALSRRELP